MSKRLILFLYCLLFFTKLGAQSFVANGGAIPDAGPQTSFPITISGLQQPIINTSFGLSTVCVNITHSRVGDLTLKLKAPDGMIISLSLNEGGNGDNYINTCFNTASPHIIYLAMAPFTGTYKPVGALGNVNNGQNGNGVWELLIEDLAHDDTGTLINFSLTFDQNPSQPSSFVSSNLPIVVINTNGVTIRDEPKEMARMGIIYNGVGLPNHVSDPYNNYNGWVGIEYRGSSSGSFPQRSYNFETSDISGNELNAPLLAMPTGSDWALVAVYGDETLMRNAITYELCNQMHYYAPRARFCEVVLDGEYVGVYLLTEKIKRDGDRVDIAKLTPQDTTGDEVTGGYIIKIDKSVGDPQGSWDSPYPPMNYTGNQQISFQFHYPRINGRPPQQDNYIKEYIDSFENALASPDFRDTNTGYRHFADINSFIDNFIINEISRNIDAYAVSYFFYKDKNSKGGKLKSGPVWDYNLAWYYAWWCNANSDTGWAYNVSLECVNAPSVPFWWGRMLEDTSFTNALRCRWHELRNTTLSISNIYNLIDNTALYLSEAQPRQAERWLAVNIFSNELAAMKNWISLRTAWLDAHIPGVCSTPLISFIPEQKEHIDIYPNPFYDNIQLDLTTQSGGDLAIKICSSLGQLVYEKTYQLTTGKNHLTLEMTEQLASGLYLLKASTKDYSYSQRIIKQVK